MVFSSSYVCTEEKPVMMNTKGQHVCFLSLSGETMHIYNVHLHMNCTCFLASQLTLLSSVQLKQEKRNIVHILNHTHM